MDGESLLPALQSCAADKPRTQYFEITGKMGLYHDGWFLSGEDGRTSWENLGPGGARPEVTWTLYDFNKNFSQSTDLSAQYPERSEAMTAMCTKKGANNNV